MKVKGYKIIQYQCKTDDQAILALWRIVPQQNANQFRRPVLIQHGLLDCSMSWFLNQNIQKCLPYILASRGFDVWIGNNRGTKFSYKNTQPNKQYWQYSLDQLIKYDVIALIDFILQNTKCETLTYIGHSQGSTQFLSALDQNKQLKNKIQSFIGLGPIINLRHVKNHKLLKIVDKLKICQILKLIGFQAVFLIPRWMGRLFGVLIYNCPVYLKAFNLIVNELCGYNTSDVKICQKRFGAILSHQPGGTSVNNVDHWMQIFRKGEFRKFDFGTQKNKIIYNNPLPPLYTFESLKQIKFPVYLFKGTSDAVVTDEDFKFLISKLQNSKYQIIQLNDYAHLDYVWGKNAHQDIYSNIVSILQRKLDNSTAYDEENSF